MNASNFTLLPVIMCENVLILNLKNCSWNRKRLGNTTWGVPVKDDYERCQHSQRSVLLAIRWLLITWPQSESRFTASLKIYNRIRGHQTKPAAMEDMWVKCTTTNLSAPTMNLQNKNKICWSARWKTCATLRQLLVASVEPLWLEITSFYMQEILCSVVERTVQWKCWFCGPDKGAFYACAFTAYIHSMFKTEHCIVQKRMYVYAPALVAAAPTVFMAWPRAWMKETPRLVRSAWSHQNKSQPDGVCDLPHWSPCAASQVAMCSRQVNLSGGNSG